MCIEHKVLATGTPLQNSVDVLFLLVDFMEPGRFGDADTIQADFGAMRESTDEGRLQALLHLLMLRRLKEDVDKLIPVKEETVIEV
jgi:SNF2 family DNA or RNA helicase